MAMGGTMKSPRASEAGRIMSPGSSFKNRQTKGGSVIEQ